ncbi:flagellar motor switch protein FliN [Kushneria sp. Sum13]|uniref:flagellar motor switch protein FliN n=1 Tax=Kushneria sp. Sum13 TaxID=3459196 RepID=UPI0040465638
MTDPKNPDSPNDKSEEMPDDWASAMQEQGAASDEDDIDWGSAFAETGETPEHTLEETPPVAAAPPASDLIFQPLSGTDAHGQSRELDVIMEIPVTLSVELGRTRMTIRELLDLAKGSVVELDGLAGEPMNILINGYLIAQGEVVVVEDKYGIRITDIITPSERIHKLNR